MNHYHVITNTLAFIIKMTYNRANATETCYQHTDVISMRMHMRRESICRTQAANYSFSKHTYVII